jgi:hypothetical protein
MHKDDYKQRYKLMQGDLQKRITVLNTVDQVGWFTITPLFKGKYCNQQNHSDL